MGMVPYGGPVAQLGRAAGSSQPLETSLQRRIDPSPREGDYGSYDPQALWLWGNEL